MYTTTIISIIFILLLILSSGNIYLIIRNKRVFEFYSRNLDIYYDWCMRHTKEIVEGKEDDLLELFTKTHPTYEKMLYSFKPLKLENWIDKKTLEKLFS